MLIYALGMAAAVAGLMPALTFFLRRRALLDIPNDRSAHSVPTPRGGGWFVVGLPFIVLLGTILYKNIGFAYTSSLSALLAALALLMVVSGIDDRRGLSPAVRLAAQIIAATALVFWLPEGVRVLPLLPLFLEKIGLVLGLIWMMNLTNFMDGMDGITTVNSLVTLILLGFSVMTFPFVPLSAALLGGALTGFLVWNFPPARVFLGDVGSVPLGLWLGYLLIFLAQEHGLVPALLAVCYPLADASYTLVKRGLQGKKIWQAHSEHFYQQALRKGWSHRCTLGFIAGFNLYVLLLALAALHSPSWEYGCLGLAFLGFFLLTHLFKGARHER